MEETKFYVPQIEEFHVGFEYEVQIPEKELWSKEVFYLNDSHINLIKYVAIQNEHTKNKVRVKCLDMEDIVSLGWEKSGIGKDSFLIGDTVCLVILDEGILISKNQMVVFCGTIRNKSELVVLMKQLGIIG